MKQYTFKDGLKIIASCVEEAKAKHKVMADKRVSPYKAMKGKTAEELLGDKTSVKIEWDGHDDDMICPFCGKENYVVESGIDEDGDYRYSYKCDKCGHKWNSYYSMEPKEIWILK